MARLEPGDRIAIGDGGITLDVVARSDDGVVAEVRSGGTIQGRPGITVVGDRLEWESPTPADLERMTALAAAKVDAVAASFVRSASDLEALAAVAGPEAPMLVAKIETAAASTTSTRSSPRRTRVMVARGDLGIERPPRGRARTSQKRIIRSAVRYGRPVITATQMLESMSRRRRRPAPR